MSFLPNPSERSIRKFTLCSALLSIPFIIPSIIVSINHRYWRDDQVVPIAFAWIPLFISLGTSGGYFSRNAKPKDQAQELDQEEAGVSTTRIDNSQQHDNNHDVSRRVFIFLDVLASCGFVGVLIPVWVIEPWYMSAGDMILESYATVFLVVNMVSHFYLACQKIKASLTRPIVACSECPHCRAQSGLRMTTGAKDTRGDYSSVPETCLLEDQE